MARVGIVILAGTESHEGLGRLVHGLMVAKECKEHQDQVKIIFDGAGTQGAAELAKTGHKAHALFQAVRGDIAGACSYCASAFGVKQALIASYVPLLDEYAQHPSLRKLMTEGYQILTF